MLTRPSYFSWSYQLASRSSHVYIHANPTWTWYARGSNPWNNKFLSRSLLSALSQTRSEVSSAANLRARNPARLVGFIVGRAHKFRDERLCGLIFLAASRIAIPRAVKRRGFTLARYVDGSPLIDFHVWDSVLILRNDRLTRYYYFFFLWM